jgi:hypothetical protein
MLEKAFLKLYDEFLKLNLHIQKTKKTDIIINKQLTNIVNVCEDIAEHYYYVEINRVKEERTKEESH